MRDVDDVENAEGDRDADRHGGVEASQQQSRDHGIDQQLYWKIHAAPFPPMGVFCADASGRNPPLPVLCRKPAALASPLADAGGRETRLKKPRAMARGILVQS